MASLDRCIKLSGLHPTKARKLQAAAFAYRLKGLKTQESNESAVKDAIKSLEAEKAQLSELTKTPEPIEPAVHEATVGEPPAKPTVEEKQELADATGTAVPPPLSKMTAEEMLSEWDKQAADRDTAKAPTSTKDTEKKFAGKDLSKVIVETKAIRESTGEEITIREDAKTALAEIDAELETAHELRACIES